MNATLALGNRHRCAASSKIRYRDEATARVALMLIQARRRYYQVAGRPIEQYLYRCSSCAGVHLTHVEQRGP